jgi:hypothetical protein
VARIIALNRIFRVLPLLLAAASCVAAADTLCTPSEQVVFSCRIGKAGKLVSLCASPGLSRDQGALAYRFGRPGRVELQFPAADVQDGAGRFRYAHYFRSQVDRTEITFRSGHVRYAVFSYQDADETPSRKEGVRVSQPGRASELLCSGKSVKDFSRLEDSVPCDEDNALANCK